MRKYLVSDKFRISTVGLPEIPKGESAIQQFLTKGYRIFRVEEHWYAERDKQRIKIDETNVTEDVNMEGDL